MTKKGFTLVELMVTVTIMMIMTAVVLFNYNSFNDSTLMNSVAYDLSLTIRQAQTYGIATRGAGGQVGDITTTNFGGGGLNFSSSYGVHFDSSPGDGLVLFADTSDDDSKYISGADTLLQSYTFQRGIKIQSLCVDSGSPSTRDCTTPVTLDITFHRPDPEAIISFNGAPPSAASDAVIILKNANGSIKKSVTVYSTGQISVGQVVAP